MRKKRIMIIGPGNCGKTSLANVLNDDSGPPRKTQDTIFAKNTIDVPGAYVENTWMYMHTIALAQDAKCILVMVDPSASADIYSPGFAKVFRCPVIGIVSKCDLVQSDKERWEKQLRSAGVEGPCFFVSVKTGEGIDELLLYLQEEGLFPV